MINHSPILNMGSQLLPSLFPLLFLELPLTLSSTLEVCFPCCVVALSPFAQFPGCKINMPLRRKGVDGATLPPGLPDTKALRFPRGVLP